MKRYKDYMDAVETSDTLHEKLKNLEPPQKRPAAWKKYGAAAAALILVAGIGAYGLSQSQGGWNAVMENFRPAAEVAPGKAEIPAPFPNPDIVPAGPFADPNAPSDKTGGGYEVVDGEMAVYYTLPHIDYGMSETRTEVFGDVAPPPWKSTERRLTQADIAALFGGKKNLSDHLAWGDYQLSGWAIWDEDGSFWKVSIGGEKGGKNYFSFAFSSGSYPPANSCFGNPNGVEQEIWGLTVIAWGRNDWADYDRRVEFLHDGCGFRFDVTNYDPEQAEMLVSRLVRWIATEGLALNTLTPDGAAPVYSWLDDYWDDYLGDSVGEPNWEDGEPDEAGDGFDPDCPYCAAGTVHTHPYDPNVAAEAKAPTPSN